MNVFTALLLKIPGAVKALQSVVSKQNLHHDSSLYAIFQMKQNLEKCIQSCLSPLRQVPVLAWTCAPQQFEGMTESQLYYMLTWPLWTVPAYLKDLTSLTTQNITSANAFLGLLKNNHWQSKLTSLLRRGVRFNFREGWEYWLWI